MNAPPIDDDLEAIADANDIHANIGTRGKGGRKLGTRIKRPTKLSRIFGGLKAGVERRKKKQILHV